MCHSTLIDFLCTCPSCPTPNTPYKTTTSIDPCAYLLTAQGCQPQEHIWRKNPAQHPWYVCSTCIEIGGVKPIVVLWPKDERMSPKTKRFARGRIEDGLKMFHEAEVEHFVMRDGRVIWREGLCSDCQSQAEAVENEDEDKTPRFLNPPTLTMPTRISLLAALLPSDVDPRLPIAEHIATLAEPLRLKHGLPPHAWACGILFFTVNLGSRISEPDKPKQIRAITLCLRLNISGPAMSHAYSHLFHNRDMLFAAIEDHPELSLKNLKKPCCFRRQDKACPQKRCPWKRTREKCTGTHKPDYNVYADVKQGIDFNYEEFKRWWFGNYGPKGPLNTDAKGNRWTRNVWQKDLEGKLLGL